MKCVCLERNVLTGALTYGRADRGYLLSNPSNKRGLLTISTVFFFSFLFLSPPSFSCFFFRRWIGRKCPFADFALSTLSTDRRYGLSALAIATEILPRRHMVWKMMGNLPKLSSTIFLVFTRLAEQKLLQLLRNRTWVLIDYKKKVNKTFDILGQCVHNEWSKDRRSDTVRYVV